MIIRFIEMKYMHVHPPFPRQPISPAPRPSVTFHWRKLGYFARLG